MTHATSILAYPDVKDVLDRALQSERGVKLQFDTSREAERFKARACMFRVLVRRENAKIYEIAHSLHGRSVYDCLIIGGLSPLVTVIPLKEGRYIVEEL